MEFSDTFRQTGNCLSFSPDGKYMATAVETRLVVRFAESQQVAHIFSCLDRVQGVEWSADSEYVLCAMYKRAMVQVWSVYQPEWTCRIDEGAAGMTHVRWSPDCRHVITTSDFCLRWSVWSLVSNTSMSFRYPKFSDDRGMSFSGDGRLMAVAERGADCKDQVSIYSTQTFDCIHTFLPDTKDLANLSWSADGHTLAVWDSVLEYNLLLYSSAGELLQQFSAYANALGIKSVSWSPSGDLMCVGSYDGMARVMNTHTWVVLAELNHTATVKGPPKVVVYKEVLERDPLTDVTDYGNGVVNQLTATRYEVAALPEKVPVAKADPSKPNPKQGVGMQEWSRDGKLLATRNDSQPNTVWIWDVTTLSLASVLRQVEPLRGFQWDPKGSHLAVITGGAHVYLWAPEGASSVCIPANVSAETVVAVSDPSKGAASTFRASTIQWSPDGFCIALLDRESYCCAYTTGVWAAEPSHPTT